MKRLLKNAGFSDSGACVEDIEYHVDCNLNKTQIASLATCNYVTEHHNILLLGATSRRKTYLACVLGMAATRNFLTVKYVRLPELLTELAIARGNGTYRKVIGQYKKPFLLVLDEWLLYPLKETEERDLLEIAEARYKKAFTIFCSQFDVPGWREKIRFSRMLSATESFTILTASSSTARNPCESARESKRRIKRLRRVGLCSAQDRLCRS